MRLRFLGATGTVTGSKYLLTPRSGRPVLIDCGLFQGYKQLRLRNWEPFPGDPAAIDAVVLTHAHLDHSGYLPLLVRNGFHGHIYCTPATAELCALLLPDSAHLQEEEANFANRHGYSKHRPALPLYTSEDAQRALDRLHPVDYDRDIRLDADLTCRFAPSGHLLGSALVSLRGPTGTLTFSGDLGRAHDLTMRPPARIARADYLIVESTYGDRQHEAEDPIEALGRWITCTAARGGVVLIPAFAVGRTQTVLYCIHRLKAQGRIPDLPVFLDSPMAIDATEMFRRHAGEHRIGPAETEAMCRAVRYVTTPEESKALSALRVPMVLISASGMATGGRVLHHLKAFAPDHRNSILFTGYQAGGTRGASFLAGAATVKIHGDYVPVRAEVGLLPNLSAHADRGEIIEWLRGFDEPPRMTYITHGEPAAADALRLAIQEQLGWCVRVPEYQESALLFT
ncbi:MAG: MBL fold metallo-hydrolase [Methylotetracoccus sp.]